MFKVGDKVICINFIEDMDEDNFTIDNVYKVIKIPFTNSISVYDDNGDPWTCDVDAFEKYKKYHNPPKNDIEWMDKVQKNFSEEEGD